jgi:hypothetical protein
MIVKQSNENMRVGSGILWTHDVDVDQAIHWHPPMSPQLLLLLLLLLVTWRGASFWHMGLGLQLQVVLAGGLLLPLLS